MKKPLLLLSILFIMMTCAKDHKDTIVTIHTRYGDMKVLLYDETPKHKANFIELALSGRYDSTVFHRIIEGFMIQGGDIAAKKGEQPTQKTIPAEFVEGLYHGKGALAAARQGDMVNPEQASSWCQFYIVDGKTFTEAELTVDQRKLNEAIGELMQLEAYADLKAQLVALQEQQDFEGMNKLTLSYVDTVENVLHTPLKKEIDPERLSLYTTTGGAPHLDGAYTVFGRVIEGLDVIDRLAEVETASADRPVEDVHMTMSVERMPKRKVTKQYGYVYPK